MILGLLVVYYSTTLLYSLLWGFERLLRGPGSLENLNLLKHFLSSSGKEHSIQLSPVCCIYACFYLTGVMQNKFHLETSSILFQTLQNDDFVAKKDVQRILELSHKQR